MRRDLLAEDRRPVVCARRHAFGADGDADFDGAGEDLVGDLLDRKESGTAEAVCYGRGGCYGVSGCEDRGACHVALSWGEDVAETDIFDERGVEVGLFADDLGVLVLGRGRRGGGRYGKESDEKIVNVRVFQGSLLGFCKWCSCCVGDYLVSY